jgi:tetratricopeptide (TPR) repeat protein
MLAKAEDTPWEKFEKAASLYAEGGPQEQIRELCLAARKECEDSVLKARAAFLLADLARDNHQDNETLEQMREIYEGKDALTGPIAAEAKMRASGILVETGRTDAAMVLLQSVLEEIGAGPFLRNEATIALAQLYAARQSWTIADSLCALVVGNQPAYLNDERVIVLRAQGAISSGKPEEAIQLLADKKGRFALKYLARAYELAGKPIMAVGVYKKLCDLFPQSPEAEEALFQAGEVFMRADDWMAARTQYIRLLELFPESRYIARVRFRLGWVYMNLGQLTEAVAAFRDVTAGPAAPFFAYMEAECIRRQSEVWPEKRQEAILKYNSIVALHYSSRIAPLTKFRAILTMLESRQTQDAVISLRQFRALYPKHPLNPSAAFLLALQAQDGTNNKYFEEILQNKQDDAAFEAAMVALQKRDYGAAKYQDVINRKSRFQGADSVGVINKWCKLHHLLLAESAYYLRQYDMALDEYRLAETGEVDAVSRKARLGQAWCLLQTGNVEPAIVAFSALLDESSGAEYVHAAFGLATGYYHKKDFENAIRTYPVNFDPDANPELSGILALSRFKTGDAYYRLEYYAQAIETWQFLVQQFPESGLAPEALFRTGDTYFQANHFAEAIIALQQLRQNYPDHSLADKSMLKLAQCKFNAGRFEEAVADYEAFVQQYPDNPFFKNVLEGMQLCYYQLGQGEQATAALEKLIEQSPNAILSADARFRLANNYLAAGDQTKAVEAFKEILTMHPGSSYAMDAQFALAQAFYSNRDYPSAAGEFLRYLQYFPESAQKAEALFNLGISYFSIESYLSASDYFGKIISDHPESEFLGPALQNIAWCFDRLGEKSQAEHFFERYLAEYPQTEDRAGVKLQVARLRMESGRREEAIAIFQELGRSDEADTATEAWFRLGMACLETQDVTKAMQAFQQAGKIGPKGNFYRLNAISQLAALYERESQWQRAIASYRDLVENATEESWASAAQARIDELTTSLAQNTERQN